MNKTFKKIFDTCFYHRNCSDGISAAWCAKLFNAKIELVPIDPGAKKINRLKYLGKNVVFVDVCPDISEINLLDRICSSSQSVVILDHHETNEAKLVKYQNDELNKTDNLEVVFDMKRAGCQISWDYFFGNCPRPWFIDYIGDRDLWNFELINSNFINIGLYDLGYINPESLSYLYSLSYYQKDRLLNETIIPYGRIADSKNQIDIQDALRHSIKVSLLVKEREYKVYLGNISNKLRSDFGNVLAKSPFKDGTLPDFSATWQYIPEFDEWRISLRGIGRKVNLSKVAEFFGGGGHANAAGFTIGSGKTLRDYFIFETEKQ